MASSLGSTTAVNIDQHVNMFVIPLTTHMHSGREAIGIATATPEAISRPLSVALIKGKSQFDIKFFEHSLH